MIKHICEDSFQEADTSCLIYFTTSGQSSNMLLLTLITPNIIKARNLPENIILLKFEGAFLVKYEGI